MCPIVCCNYAVLGCPICYFLLVIFPGVSVFELLNKMLESLKHDLNTPFLAALTENIHVLPEFHGNRYWGCSVQFDTLDIVCQCYWNLEIHTLNILMVQVTPCGSTSKRSDLWINPWFKWEAIGSSILSYRPKSCIWYSPHSGALQCPWP